MNKFVIWFGLGGGFGGATNHVIEECKDKNEAETMAWEYACDEYETYEGMYGLRTTDEIMEEEEVDYDDAEMIYNEERESWLDYKVEPYDEEKHSDL